MIKLDFDSAKFRYCLYRWHYEYLFFL